MVQGESLNIHSFIQSLVVLHEYRTTDSIVEEIKRVVHESPFRYFSLLKGPRQIGDVSSFLIASHLPDHWLSTYKAKNYLPIDPTIRYLTKAQKPFRWREARQAFKHDPHKRRMDRMMADAGRHGLVDGYVFPVYWRNGLMGTLIVGGDVFELSSVEMALFESLARQALERIRELHGEGDAERCDADQDIDTYLTKREVEVLGYLAEGFTSREISKLMVISNHTVDWYMNGIQEKLKAKNRQHIVALAFRFGLVC